MVARSWLTAVFRRLTTRTVPHRPHRRADYSAVPAVIERLEPRLLLSTLQNFDNVGSGTPFNRLQVNNPPGATELDGGPTGVGKFLRLVDDAAPPNVNTITFQTSDAGAFNQVIADFDFRITPGIGRADGFAFALLNTATYTTPNVEPQAAAEEANYIGSLGIGFDIYQNDDLNDDGNDVIRANFSNSISVHFNSTLLAQVDVSPTLDLASGQWIHARIVMRPGGGFSDVSVILTPNGGQAVAVVDQFAIAGFTPYEGRLHYAARAGGESADFDLDNINAQFMNTSQTLLSLSAVSYVAHETQANAQVTVTRTGGSGGPVSVQYSTSNGSAAAGSDYTGIGLTTLSFGTGEMSKTFNVPIWNDPDLEGDETFLVSLSNAVGGVVGGTSTAGITIFDDETSTVLGNWDNPASWPLVAIHTHLLPTGQVMFWDRFGDTRLWNPTTNEFSVPDQPDDNLFCSGHAFLPDGKLLVTGGHHHGGDPMDDFIGLADANLYDPNTDSWTALPPMSAGRWYPTNTALPSGDMLIVSGSIDENTKNLVPEIWEKASGTFVPLPIDNADAAAAHGVDLYPRMFVLPDGRVFKAGPDQDTWFLNTETGDWTPGPAHNFGLRTYGAAVMYAPGKILVVGGGRVDDPDLEPNDDVTATAEIIDFNEPNPAWETVAPMQFARRQLNATLLPDGKVLVTGGTGGPGFNNEANPVLAAEIWDPETETWTTLSSMQVTRGYHSTAMLLLDGRVISTGGGEGAGAASFHNDAELFSPPYLFDGPRPTITAAPQAVTYGQTFFVQTPNAATISKVSLIRLPSVTHSFDENQRFNSLSFSMTAGGLSVAAPAGSTLAPPGHYMLFILDGNGVPAEGKIIQILDTGTPLINGFDTPVTYTANAPAALMDQNATVTDADTTRFNGGQLTVGLIVNAEANDRLGIRPVTRLIGLSGSNVTFRGTTIGTLAGGVGTTDLVISFNANATVSAVQTVLRNLTYRSVSATPSTAARTVQVTLTDGQGGTSNQPTKTINVGAAPGAVPLAGVLLSSPSAPTPSVFASSPSVATVSPLGVTSRDVGGTIISPPVTPLDSFDESQAGEVLLSFVNLWDSNGRRRRKRSR